MIFIITTWQLPSEFHLDQVVKELADVWDLKVDVICATAHEVLLLRKSEEEFHYGYLFLLYTCKGNLLLLLF